jgi:hypothetical protein
VTVEWKRVEESVACEKVVDKGKEVWPVRASMSFEQSLKIHGVNKEHVKNEPRTLGRGEVKEAKKLVAWGLGGIVARAARDAGRGRGVVRGAKGSGTVDAILLKQAGSSKVTAADD